jgi:2-phospho-L-lactate transferase/gluconeogenesis factor (CofD/UPF0052 family)
MVFGEINLISGNKYTIFVKFVDVETGENDAEVGNLNESFTGLDNLQGAVKQITAMIDDRLQTRGKVQQMVADKVYVDIGKNDGVIEGTTVKVERQGVTELH